MGLLPRGAANLFLPRHAVTGDLVPERRLPAADRARSGEAFVRALPSRNLLFQQGDGTEQKLPIGRFGKPTPVAERTLKGPDGPAPIQVQTKPSIGPIAKAERRKKSKEELFEELLKKQKKQTRRARGSAGESAAPQQPSMQPPKLQMPQIDIQRARPDRSIQEREVSGEMERTDESHVPVPQSLDLGPLVYEIYSKLKWQFRIDSERM